MKHEYVIAACRDFLHRALRTPKTSALMLGALVLVGVGTTIGINLVSARPADASGTCQPNTDYAFPSSLSLASAPSSVTVVDDGVSTYGIGGDDIGLIRRALNTCAPSFMGSDTSGEFLAYTSYTLNWNYDITTADGITCSLSNVKVGLHLSQLEPRLMNKNPSPAVAAKWNAFSTGLREHEDGHKALDITYANGLAESLASVRTDCNVIPLRVGALTSQTLRDIISANAQHDSDTDYGGRQGAVW